MAQKESVATNKKHKEAPVSEAPGGPLSAPELPPAVARQYGLHRYRSAHGSAAEAQNTDDGIQEDAETEAAVDDIVSKESDTVLQAEDEQFQPPAGLRQKRGFWRTFCRPFAFWWRHAWLRWLTVFVLLAAIGTLAAVPATRYTLLNKAGVRSTAGITVLDQKTQLPLKGVQVVLAGVSAQTDKNGVAVLQDVPLGPATLTIRRLAFAPITKDVVVGWGSNPLGTFTMDATGVRYIIRVSDFLSGKALEGAEASSGTESNALSDKQGVITLTVNDTESTKLQVQVHLPGYRTETLQLLAGQTTDANIALVPEQKAVFVSRSSGKYDLYTMDIDGKNRQVVLAGTGSESQNISLVVNSAGDRAAMVSTREPVRDSDGYLLSSLTLVDLRSGTATTLEHAAQIQLADWIGNRLVYRLGQPGASDTDDTDQQRYKLVSYDVQSKSRVQLAAANQFTATVSAGGIIYYAVSSPDPGAQTGFFKIKPDGSGKIHLFQQEVWSAMRSSYNTIMLQTPNNWYSYVLGAAQPTLASQPSSFASQAYIEDVSGNSSLWIDERDGKGTLLTHDTKANADTVVHAQDGLVYPVRWLNSQVVMYRVATARETADYVKSLAGGDARKLSDVANTFGYLR